MAIKSDIPQIHALRERVENKFGKTLYVHADFVELMTVIEMELRQHISETTLERVWSYSTRGYDNVSVRTLNVLAKYACNVNWDNFCEMLRKENKIESEVFNTEMIFSKDLNIGDRIRFGWLPDRICEARYLGDDKFVAEHCENSTIKEGDTFVCSQFVLGKELQMNKFCQQTNVGTSLHGVSSCGKDIKSKVYIVGREHGLTTLVKI